MIFTAIEECLGFIVLATGLVMENNIIRLTARRRRASPLVEFPAKLMLTIPSLRQQLAMLPSAAAMIQPDKPPG